MNKKLVSKLIALSLFATVTTVSIAPSIVSASNLSNPNKVINQSKDVSFKILNQDEVSVNGKIYNITSIANSIRNEIDYTVSDTTHSRHKRNAATVAVKKAFKWVVKHWHTIYNKLPNWAKKYLKLDAFISAADQFLGVSDSIEDFFHRTFRSMSMPETANWIITNIIMLILPI